MNNSIYFVGLQAFFYFYIADFLEAKYNRYRSRRFSFILTAHLSGAQYRTAVSPTINIERTEDRVMNVDAENAKAVEGGDTFPEQLTEEHKLDEELHIHMHENGIAHSHGKGHRHVHSKAEKKAVLNRLSKAIGHLEAVKRMVERDADCSEVLIQLAAVRSAINNTGKVVLKNHMNHCIVEAVEENDQDAITKLSEAIDKFIK